MSDAARHDRPWPEEPLKLFDDTPVLRVYEGRAPETIQEAFERFLELNPWVYTAIVRLARDLVARGHDRIGIGMLTEVVRWQYHRSTSDQVSPFKVNNNYRSRLSRLIMEREPDLAGVFEVRKLTSA